MTSKLKVLLLILLINFLFFNIFSLTQVKSKEKNCNNYSVKNLDLKNYNFPIKFEITIPNSKKWTQRMLKSMGGDRIKKDYKKYQRANFKVTYSNAIKCVYNGKIRIHGSTKDHINEKSLNSSVRVILNDNHINNKYNFALLNKKSTSFKDEIFVSTFFEELGYLAPLNYITKVKINNNIEENYLFLEMPTLEMGKDEKRNNGIFLAANKNNFEKNKTTYKYRRSIILGRAKNSDGIDQNNKNTILYALDKINYIYLNSLGIGDGMFCCNYTNTKIKKPIERNYNNGIYSLNFSILDDQEEIKKNSIFNLLMNSTNSQHGLALEDRMFFYDPTFDRLEPIYRDGDASIVQQNNFNINEIQLFEFEKKFIKETIIKINQIKIEDFKKKLFMKGLNLKKEEIENILNNIILNLKIINKTSFFKNFINKNTENYFKKHFDNNLKFYLAFEGKNNKFEICNIEMTKCEAVKLKAEQVETLLNDKFLNLKKFSKPIMYTRFTKSSYLLNTKPKERGLKNFKKMKLNDGTTIYTNAKLENVKVDENNREILLNQTKQVEKFIFVGNNFSDWKIKFKGLKKKQITNYYKRDENMIGGCVTFINSIINNISISIDNNSCGKGVEVLNSEGYFSNININGSKLDAFDSEFSNLLIDNISIDGAYSGECIGLKRGKYTINNAILNDCKDHAVSVGEHAELTLHKVKVQNSTRGIMSKASSKITIFNYTNNNSKGCLISLRKNKYYDGSLINIKEDELFCDNKKIQKDKFSNINFF